MESDFSYPEIVAEFASVIQAYMVENFRISPEEAAGRIKRAWRLQQFEKGEDDLIFHEDEEFWAKTIYYGSDVRWWLPDEELTPLPYP